MEGWTKKWAVIICYKRKNIIIGYFEDEIQAAKEYDKAAKKYHGEFASLNFPDSPRRTRRATKKI